MFNIQAVSKDLVEEGQWFDISLAKDASVKLASLNNTAFQKAQEKLNKQFQRGRNKEISSEDKMHIYRKALSEHVLKDWKGIGDGEKEIPYTPEIGYKALEDNPDFFSEVVDLAGDYDAYRKEETAEKAKK